MRLTKEVGQRALGRCYYDPINSKNVSVNDEHYYEVELEVRMPRGKQRKVSFLIRYTGNELIVKDGVNPQTRVPIYPVTRQVKKEAWMDDKECQLLNLSGYYRRRATKKSYCKDGVLRLPLYFDKEDLNKVIYLTIYPSIISDEEYLVIESNQIPISKQL